jgi:hypothetical protein
MLKKHLIQIKLRRVIMRHGKEATKIREGNVTMADMWIAKYQSKKIIRKAIVHKDEKMFFSSAKAYYKAKKGGDTSMTTA